MKAFQQSVASGLSTDTFKIGVAGIHSINTMTSALQPSGLVVTISQSGSATSSMVSPTTSPLQQNVTLNAKFNCAVGDILTVALTSSANIDQPPNLIKTLITLRQGL